MIFENYWPAYFLHYYVQCRLLKRKIPILAGFKITHDCNLKCRHCPYWKKAEAGNGSLTFGRVVDILRALKQQGVRIIIFEGGEPFLWKDNSHTIYDVIREAKKLFFSVGLVTNGTFPLDVPAEVLWVSIDGLQDSYSQIRGGLFERIIEHIDQSPHPNLLANITINTINQHEIADLLKYLSKKVKGITIQFHYPYDGDKTLCLSPAQRDATLQEIIKLKQEGYPVADSFNCLEALRENQWKCEDWMLVNVEPDGRINSGCYLKNRVDIDCGLCGFAAHTEISLAFQLRMQPIFVGKKIFNYRNLSA